MPKTATEETAAPAAEKTTKDVVEKAGATNEAATPAAPKDEFPLSIDEFCSRLSASDKRVELIGAFNHVEKTAGRSNDLESAYLSRYAVFANAPA